MSYIEKGRYTGEYEEGWYHGKGKLEFETGVVYEGEFDKGEFHGNGTMFYPQKGQYKGVWDHGQLVSGEYIFTDGLKFEREDKWEHCSHKDRRFYHEKTEKEDKTVEEHKSLLFQDIPVGTYG